MFDTPLHRVGVGPQHLLPRARLRPIDGCSLGRERGCRAYARCAHRLVEAHARVPRAPRSPIARCCASDTARIRRMTSPAHADGRLFRRRQESVDAILDLSRATSTCELSGDITDLWWRNGTSRSRSFDRRELAREHSGSIGSAQDPARRAPMRMNCALRPVGMVLDVRPCGTARAAMTSASGGALHWATGRWQLGRSKLGEGGELRSVVAKRELAREHEVAGLIRHAGDTFVTDARLCSRESRAARRAARSKSFLVRATSPRSSAVAPVL